MSRFPLPPLVAARLLLKAIARARKESEGKLHAAADSHVRRVSIAFRFAFAMGRRALKRDIRGVDAAVKAVEETLQSVLPGMLLKIVASGGQAGAELLVNKLRSAEFNPDQPRDDHGRWTDVGGGHQQAEIIFDDGKSAKIESPDHLNKFAGDSLKTPVSITGDKDNDQLGDNHVNEAFVIRDLDTDDHYVFKPIDGESFEAREEWVNNRAATLAEREVLASRIDSELGLGLVPQTAMGEFEGRRGSMQVFIHDADSLFSGDMTEEDRAKMGVLDAVIGNLDRHMGNALMKDGHLIAIDHGYAFGKNGPGDPLKSFALDNMHEGDLSPEYQKELGTKLEHFNFSKALSGAHLDFQEVDAFVERVKTVANRLKKGEAHLIRDDFDSSVF